MLPSFRHCCRLVLCGEQTGCARIRPGVSRYAPPVLTIRCQKCPTVVRVFSKSAVIKQTKSGRTDVSRLADFITNKGVFQMVSEGEAIQTWAKWFNSEGLEPRIRDYVNVTSKLIWQRQAIFLAATVLAASYYDMSQVLACYAAVLFTEVFDLLLVRWVRAWKNHDPETGRKLLRGITINTVLSAVAIANFVINITIQQGAGGHFTPLFFLFAASLFAAMNNSQIMQVLILRLSIYAGTFVFIALYDILRLRPPIQSTLWLEFFTVVFVLYFIMDVSFVFFKQYQAGLRQLEKIKEENERTKAAYEIKSQFLATVSHELRTPLTSIKASLDLINAGTLGEVPATLKPALSIAAKNGKRLSDLINDLLDLQKIEAGEMVFRFETVNVRDLVQEAVEANEGYADQFKMKLATSFPADDLFIKGDSSRLMQVMANLLSNALKFSHEGGTVLARVEPRGNRVRISVRDNGVGIPEDAKARVFGKFSQVDSSDVRKVGGTGLGLSITKEIVERHDGTVDYDSRVGEGTTFYVEFDRVAMDGESEADGGAAEAA